MENNIDKSLESKLRKLLILSERGIEGEKENASEMLNKLLKKHGLKLSDISDGSVENYWFKYKGKFQKKLLIQIIVATAGRNVAVGTNPAQRSAIGAEITKCQMLEVEILFSAYKVALEEELNFSLEAFVNKNNIFAANNGEEADREYTDEEIQRAKLMSERMMFMKKVEVHKQLTAKGQNEQ
jgi:hypothetical protein